MLDHRFAQLVLGQRTKESPEGVREAKIMENLAGHAADTERQFLCPNLRTNPAEGAADQQATLREVFMMYSPDAVLQNGVAALDNRVAECTFQVDDHARTPLDVTARLLMRQMHPYAMAVAQGLPHFVPRMPIYEVDGEETVVTVRR